MAVREAPAAGIPLRRDFATRDDLVAYCRKQFPAAAAVSSAVSPTRGGIVAAQERLAAVRPVEYGRSRNQFDGAVTRLSPYLRHGVVGLAEARDHAIARAGGSTERAEKLLNQLAWRDYWRRVLAEIGDGVWIDREAYKTGFGPDDYADELPDDFLAAETGIDFIDDTVRTLHATGWVHNQARMKVASYVVHWRRVKWQAGARWMLSHLLDADLAANNLSWQWVASTFASKPYIFNLENLHRWTGGRYSCRGPDGQSPFDATYEELERRLFPHL